MKVAESLIRLDGRWRVVFVGAAFDGSKFSYSVAEAARSEQLQRSVEALWRRSPQVGQIKFVGRRSDALEIIASSNVLFSTSVIEGFPNVVLESMAV